VSALNRPGQSLVFAVADSLPFWQFLESQTPSINPVIVEATKLLQHPYNDEVKHAATHRHNKGDAARNSAQN
jgi:hypothetical protein